MTISFDIIGIAVQDMGKALAFYRRLGLPIPAGADDEPHVDVTLPNGMRIAWDKPAIFDDKWTPSVGGYRIAVGFLCGSPAEVDSVYADMTGAGHEGYMPPWDAFWGQRYAVLKDPDGNSVDLFCPLDGTTGG
jgi:catechol 2,3-dioxygenase-like lactoylglutathione lyase family enzyme